MTKNKSQRLKPVVQQAEIKEQQAVEAFVKQQQVLQLYRDKQQELHAYRCEYIDNMKKANVEYSVIEFKQQRHFLQKLNDAINFQQVQCTKQQQVLESYKQKWLQAKQRTAGFEQLIEKSEQQVLDTLVRHEQKTQDDRAQHRH